MLLCYDSMTGNVRRFINKLPFEAVDIRSVEEVHEPFIMVTYTIQFGKVPESTASFLEKNHSFMKAVASSGNKVWGEFFARAGKLISETYSVPLLAQFELGGTTKDVEHFIREVERIDSDSKRHKHHAKMVEI